MFPKLSQKGQEEIRKSIDLHPIEGLSAYEFLAPVEAFMSLFDLEKYPITKDMIFEYLRDVLRLPDERQEKLSGSSISTPDYYVFDLSYGAINHNLIDHTGSVIDQIRDIALSQDKDKIVIIGEIHGWWEKGDQND